MWHKGHGGDCGSPPVRLTLAGLKRSRRLADTERAEVTHRGVRINGGTKVRPAEHRRVADHRRRAADHHHHRRGSLVEEVDERQGRRQQRRGKERRGESDISSSRGRRHQRRGKDSDRGNGRRRQQRRREERRRENTSFRCNSHRRSTRPCRLRGAPEPPTRRRSE